MSHVKMFLFGFFVFTFIIDKSSHFLLQPTEQTPGDLGSNHTTTNSTKKDWTVIQRRSSDKVDFYRDWDDYVAGFGVRGHDFWLGLEQIHSLCNKTTCELRVKIQHGGRTDQVKYTSFTLTGSDDLYRYYVTGYTGSGHDALSYINGSPFSTRDRDNDAWVDGSCSVDLRAGWWFYACSQASLNGLWGEVYPRGVWWMPAGLQTTDRVDFVEMSVKQTI